MLEVLILLLVSIDLSPEVRMRNPGNYCTWTCLDTLARVHGIPSLKGILRQRWERNHGAFTDAGNDYLIRQELTSRGVKFLMTNQFSYDRTLLEKYADSFGVSVCFLWRHQVIVTSYSSDWVEFYDPNLPQCNLICGRGWFDKWWLGNSIVVFP